jgi:hypothetical protein
VVVAGINVLMMTVCVSISQRRPKNVKVISCQDIRGNIKQGVDCGEFQFGPSILIFELEELM